MGLLITNKVFSITVLSLNYFFDQFVASESRHSTETSLRDLSAISMVVFSDEGTILIKSLHLEGYTAKRFTNEFPEKGWTKRCVNKIQIPLR